MMTYCLNGVRYGRSINLEFKDLESARGKARRLSGRGTSSLILTHINEAGVDVKHESIV